MYREIYNSLHLKVASVQEEISFIIFFFRSLTVGRKFTIIYRYNINIVQYTINSRKKI